MTSALAVLASLPVSDSPWPAPALLDGLLRLPGSPATPAVLATLAAGMLILLERRTQPAYVSLAPLLLIAVLAGLVFSASQSGLALAPLTIAFVVAILARDETHPFHAECGIKMLWLMGSAVALSWAGLALMTLATGTSVIGEQWGVLAMGLVPRIAWSTALSLSLLVGVVMLGAAPFHSWVADVLQGARPWVAPAALAALQVVGATWLIDRLANIEFFPAAAQVAGVLLGAAAAAAFAIGAATLITQRRPERRTGTLASLQGALVLAVLAATRGRADTMELGPFLTQWGSHLLLALTGAATLSHFMPGSAPPGAPGVSLFRRHPWSGVAGLFALFSLAGVPGTPGAALWLQVAGILLGAGQPVLLLLLALAWFAGFFTVMQQLRDAFGAKHPAPPTGDVPWQARTALWMSGGGLALIAAAALAAARR
jgi:NADH:ubiquinone oxidoreductase subunit 2 (subunit N)